MDVVIFWSMSCIIALTWGLNVTVIRLSLDVSVLSRGWEGALSINNCIQWKSCLLQAGPNFLEQSTCRSSFNCLPVHPYTSLVVRMERSSVCCGVPLNDCGFLTFLTATSSLLVCVWLTNSLPQYVTVMYLDIAFPGVHTSLFKHKLYQYIVDALVLSVWPGFKLSLLTGF